MWREFHQHQYNRIGSSAGKKNGWRLHSFHFGIEMNEKPLLFGYGSAKSVLVIATAIDRLTSPKPQAWCVFWDFIRKLCMMVVSKAFDELCASYQVSIRLTACCC